MISPVHKYCGQQSHICGNNVSNDVHRHLQAETVFGCIRQLHIVQLVVSFGPSGMVPRFRIDLKEIEGKHLAVPDSEWAQSGELE
jgi:hypothetical protein